MPRIVPTTMLVPVVMASFAISAAAQSFDGPGTRAAGMGAFVAVADDASAVYWNPAGLASGAYFSLAIDRTEGESTPDGADRGAKRSSWLLALSAPVVGLSYYRLRSSTFSPAGAGAPGLSRVESLVTHHAGATLVQTIFRNLAAGATVKIVRGIATTGLALRDSEDLLEGLELGVATNRLDVDAGLMSTGSLVRAGVTFRNLMRPEFDAGGDETLRLDRQVRAGIALLLTRRWTAAADLDLTRQRSPAGDVRTLAFGAEGRISTRAIARGGVRFNTAADSGSSPVASIGASYAVFGSLLVDAHYSAGSERGFGGWGVAGRVVF